MSNIELTSTTALAYWRRAAKEELGVRFEIKQTDLDKIKAMCYKARKEANDPKLENLVLVVAPGGTEIWMVKKTTELP